jgi:hypothetical protein
MESLTMFLSSTPMAMCPRQYRFRKPFAGEMAIAGAH